MSLPINLPISRLTLAIALTAGGAVGAGTAARALDDDATSGVTSRPLVASEAVVTAVVDGDTLRAETLTGDDLGRVRLLGVDAPEAAHPGHPAQCHATEATRLLRKLLPAGARVMLTIDPARGDVDIYGRLLRYVDTNPGTTASRDVAVELLAAGAVRPYRGGPPLARRAEYEAAAAQAQDSGRLAQGAGCGSPSPARAAAVTPR